MLPATWTLSIGPQHCLHHHQCSRIWICPRCSIKCNRKLGKRNIIINIPKLILNKCQTTQCNCFAKKSLDTAICKHTSEPVKIAGSFAANSEVVAELSDNFVNSFSTCLTISSCLTAPEAAITYIVKCPGRNPGSNFPHEGRINEQENTTIGWEKHINRSSYY